MYPVSAATAKTNESAASSNSGASSTATDYQSMFMQLLATELQSQDPTQTMDPTTMVTQMVQINQLSDVSGIYSLLQGASGTAPAANATHAAAAAASAASPVSSTISHPAQNTMGGN
jgi:flagellar basal-body rod modification protein FlgD